VPLNLALTLICAQPNLISTLFYQRPDVSMQEQLTVLTSEHGRRIEVDRYSGCPNGDEKPEEQVKISSSNPFQVGFGYWHSKLSAVNYPEISLSFKLAH